jgi:hypothetical protein
MLRSGPIAGAQSTNGVADLMGEVVTAGWSHGFPKVIRIRDGWCPMIAYGQKPAQGDGRLVHAVGGDERGTTPGLGYLSHACI